MIEAVFQDHLTFLALAVAATLATGVVVCLIAARRVDRVRAVLYGLWASSTIGPIILTTWGGSGTRTLACTVDPAVTEAFTTTQGQLNILLFTPFGLFAALATRRPVFSAGLGILFTASVETAQAAMPYVARLCDTDDLATNAAGVLIGVIVGTLTCRIAPGGTPLAPFVVRRAVIAGTATSLIIVAVWATAIEPVRAVLPTEVPIASVQQVQALDTALEAAFDDAYVVKEANFHHNVEGPDTINTPLPGGFAELTWPDREKLTIHFTPTNHGEGTHAYRIPGTSKPVRTAEEAQEVATLFAQRRMPWALRDSNVRTWPIDANDDSLGWVVEWRRWQGKLLMPMRLDIVIEPSGRLTGLIARDVDDPKLPRIEINKDEAWQAFESHHKIKPGQAERAEPVYLVEREGDEWRVHWRLAARQENTLFAAIVDATTGKVLKPSAVPAGGEQPAEEGVEDP
ncbi:VanZ family protein [Streptomyces kurssanovii]|uniref:VanZ family protein n=1 Tax=Streptomyces kurssanovii TaxID=67312 RepID=A0ABV3HXE8_9ACTN